MSRQLNALKYFYYYWIPKSTCLTAKYLSSLGIGFPKFNKLRVTGLKYNFNQYLPGYVMVFFMITPHFSFISCALNNCFKLIVTYLHQFILLMFYLDAVSSLLGGGSQDNLIMYWHKNVPFTRNFYLEKVRAGWESAAAVYFPFRMRPNTTGNASAVYPTRYQKHWIFFHTGPCRFNQDRWPPSPKQYQKWRSYHQFK